MKPSVFEFVFETLKTVAALVSAYPAAVRLLAAIRLWLAQRKRKQ